MAVNVFSLHFFEGSFFMKVVRKICCGADIHKDLIVATIATTNQEGITEYLQTSFCTQNYDLFNFKSWLKEHNCFEVAMESTGKYWIPIFNVLEDEIKISLVHPKYTKSIKGKKTDKKDSKWIADLFKYDLVKSSFIPPKEIRQIRDLCRYRIKLIGMRTSERNRYQNCMTMSNIGLASILSDSFGKSSKAIMNEVLTSKSITEDRIKQLLKKSAKKKSEEVFNSLKDCIIESDQRLKMKVITEHMEHLDKHIEDIETEIIKRCVPYSVHIENMVRITGISYMSAMTILGEIGADMEVFESDKQLISWAGLAPANNESAYKKKSVRISKAGAYLKPLLVQCALSAIKSIDPYFRNKYNNIKKRRGHKKAIIAIARKLLVAIYHMIETGEIFNPSDYEETTNPKPSKNKNISKEEALAVLQNLGYDISSISAQMTQ